jgi:hypothetical protein
MHLQLLCIVLAPKSRRQGNVKRAGRSARLSAQGWLALPETFGAQNGTSG